VYNIPITICYRIDDEIFFLPSSVPIDSVVSLYPLDSDTKHRVGYTTLTDRFPRCVIRLLECELVVSENYHDLVRYLDAYKTIEEDFKFLASRKPDRSVRAFSLIEGGMCVTSQESTPDSPGQS